MIVNMKEIYDKRILRTELCRLIVETRERNRMIFIKPSDCKRKNETRMSPFNKNEHLEGYWSLVTDTFEELDIKPVIDDLLRKLEGKLEIIKEICKENNGEVCFEIVPIFEKDNLPAIYFEKRFLNIVNYLDAVIDIDMYLN